MKRWIEHFSNRTLLLTGLGLAAVFSAQASSITVSPSGEVAEVRQIRLNFSEPVVAAGDLRLPAPAILRCGDAAGARNLGGTGRWSSAREWLFDLNEPLSAGLQCQVLLKDDFKPIGGALTGPREFGFSTGAAIVLQTQPWSGSQIEEDQHFLLKLNGSLPAAEVAKRAWCEVEGLGERLPALLADEAARAAVLKARQISKNIDRQWLLLCQRPLPAGAKLQLVWSHGKAGATQRFDYQVRSPFTADFSCERERANAPCIPVRPLRLMFSEPVARELALKVRLKSSSGAALAPKLAADDTQRELTELRFPAPLAENGQYTLELPAGLKDVSGRLLSNAASFPLRVVTGGAPPLAKFAAAPFGVIERDAAGPALLPITMRHVQSDWGGADKNAGKSPGEIRSKRVQTDAEVLAWYAKLKRYHEASLSARELGLPPALWHETVKTVDAAGKTQSQSNPRFVHTREVELLPREQTTQVLALPPTPVAADAPARPFEVIGLPLAEPGYHVVEIRSAKLGRSLLDKDAAMFVRTGVLVTNLGVHFKWGRENSVVWVTTLDRGRPVAQADVAVYDCTGKALWNGRTDSQGLAKVGLALVLPDWGDQRCVAERGFFITARKTDSEAQAAGPKPVDMAFVFSNWNRGIENWRFGLPTGNGPEPDARAHTVLDRSLLRAGETVSMKHFFRLETAQGLSFAKPALLPERVKLTHEGSGQQIELPLTWGAARGSSQSQWMIPANAKLGTYRISLERGQSGADSQRGRSWPSGDFRVEEFRVPLIDARLSGPKTLPVAPGELRMTAQLNYMAGGGLAQAPLKLSAILRPRPLSFAGFEEFVFEPPRERGASGAGAFYQEQDMGEDGEGQGRPAQRDGKLVVDKLAGMTDRKGAAELLLKPLPKITRASELLAELSYQDPNGETKTVAQALPLWPSKVVLGLRSRGWVSNADGKLSFTAVALDTAGKPLAGQRIEVTARLNQTISTRKRMVGGFYAYDNRNEVKDLGAVCSGRSDDRGLLACEGKLQVAGEVELVAQASDADGRAVQAASTVWVTRQGELWFEQNNDDRIDVLAEKKRYEPGETARLQVRMPFREATALVAVEREGVIETRVVTLRGSDPTIELKIDKAWAPNVYVSVLALRGRIVEVPWYSFFRWGWRAPVDWWRAWREGRNMPAPTAMVDLAKPSFKLGVAELQVGLAEHQLQVTVTTDKPQYSVRQTVQTRVKVSQNGRPLADAEVAFAAVDEGLLALRGNVSWDLLQSLMQRRSWGVETATAQSEIIGRRHYGRKAVAAGGGGGHAPTRELFDTLLLWRPVVKLDAEGEALIEVPLNDSLSSFRLVAIADAGAHKFGSGQTSVRVTQDLQLLSGLPPLVREGDQFQAALTLRNSTTREMKLRVSLEGKASSIGAAGKLKNPPPQEFSLAAGAARELLWQLQVPEGLDGVDGITWEAQAQEIGGTARDRLSVKQAVLPAVPVQVLQASLSQLDGNMTLAVAPPADAWPLGGTKRGGVNVVLQARLAGDLPGPRRFFENYPYTCLEQQTSQAIGLHDGVRWAALMNRLPGYLDGDGLANFFPPREGERAGGSDRLTAYVLAAAHEAGRELPAAARERMLEGLSAFVEGRVLRKTWSPRSAQLDLEVRRLAALEALSRYGRVGPNALSQVDGRNLNTWPTAAVIDWLNLHKRMAKAPQREQRMAEAQALLRSRLSYAGTTMKFSNEDADAWWWLMDSADGNAARLLLAALDDATWSPELPRMLQGLLARQRQGAWATTTANLWGVLALDKFAAKFDSGKPAGQTLASLGSLSLTQDWRQKPNGAALLLPWSEGQLKVQQQGSGKPWVTIQSLAAVPLKEALSAGYRISRELVPIEQKIKGRWSRGDLMRVRLQLDALSDMTWVVLSDPLPAGAAIMGSGLGGDASLALQAGASSAVPVGRRPTYEERSFEAWRGYFDFLPRGKHEFEYTVRLNNAGRFLLPGTRAEALYAPEQFGELPQGVLEVAP